MPPNRVSKDGFGSEKVHYPTFAATQMNGLREDHFAWKYVTVAPHHHFFTLDHRAAWANER